MATQREKAVQAAKADIGYREEANGRTKFGEWYAKFMNCENQGFENADWCAMSTSKWQYAAGLTKAQTVFTASAGPTGEALWRAKGLWKGSSYRPKPGDLIHFTWGHVGIVTKVDGNTVHTIEGNYRDMVAARSYDLSYSGIRGYAAPKYNESAGSGDTGKTEKPNTQTGSAAIRAVQTWVNKNYKTLAAVDGVYGAETRGALVGALQSYLNSRYKAGLVVDGVYGTKTRAAIRVLRKGAEGDYVRILQGLLICRGYSTNGFDGIFGGGTESAVKSYQKAVKITVDGEAGKDTFTKLCS